MTVSNKSANIEFSEHEYDILSCLASEKITDMNSRLKECDRYKYIEICQLKAKLESIVAMINYQKKMDDEQKTKYHETMEDVKKYIREHDLIIEV